MANRTDESTTRPALGRRHFLAGAAGAGALALAPGSVEAGGRHHHHGEHFHARPSAVPRPIPGGFDTGDPRVGFIHFYLPGPPGSTTPVLGLPGGGLDVEPSTITDFRGFVAFAVLAGEATDTDGNTYPCELDLRVMEGRYVAEDGERRRAAFAFV